MLPREFPPLLRHIAFALCLFLLGNSVAYAAGDPPDAEAAKAQFEKHGIGSTVRVNEANGVQVKGRILSIGADGVVLAPKGSADVFVAYSQVNSVKGPGLSTGGKVVIVVFVGVAVVGIVAVVLVKNRKIGPIATGPIR